ncbi:putative protein-serine/threonine phosphatase [Helianthus debilis subsp. tardiflorus]
MGNGVGKLTICFTGNDVVHRRKDTSVIISDPLDDLGHSFCYIRPDPTCISSSKVHSAEETTFRSISGAAVSANTATPLSTDIYSYNAIDNKASAFESSTSFASIPLQPLPRNCINSDPLSGHVQFSGPVERGFLSGPIERGFQSGPLFLTTLSGSLEKGSQEQEFQRSYSQGGFGLKQRLRTQSLIRVIQRAISRTFVSRGQNQNSVVAPVAKSVVSLKQHDWTGGNSEKTNELTISSANLSSESSFLDDDECFNHSQNLQWAQGKAGEDRVQVVMLDENPELALMGSCVLVMLMKGEDVYVMNVGDSRAVLAQKPEPDLFRQDLERINEETLYDLEDSSADNGAINPSLTACQLSVDHSTSVAEEVQRIKTEHVDDSCAVVNDRVKGSLKVTRAFGAGFLKKPKWNNALLEMFRIDYVGTLPYINCNPYLHHHKLGPRDQFLILSSDGLYQYFTNEEAVSEVELFIRWSPEGDPAQHLVEEVLFRAAKKAGMDFHELLEIPQGDRRRYHDDVSVIVISLEGRIWRSSV